MSNSLEVTFIHPRQSDRQFIAELDPSCTGAMALAGLTESGPDGQFMEPAPTNRPYELVVARTGNAITPNTTFAAAGVQNKDVIDVRQRGQGA